jgi:tetratricopeptide (TPR) repeat protein
MSPRPPIFISAVSKELRSARQLVANTLTFLGYEPVWQDIFGTEGGDLRAMLRQQIDQCKGVVQLVGQCYGAEPPIVDNHYGRISYTQFEALYARERGKKVWYLFIDETFPIEAHDPEPEELHELQAAYRRRVQADAHLFHSLTSREALEAGVLKLRDDLTKLRRGVKQWALGVAILLIVSVGLGFWLLRGQRETTQEMRETKKALTEMASEMAKLRQGLLEYPQAESQVRQSRKEEDPAVLQDRVYKELSKKVGVDDKLLRSALPRLAENLKHAPDATNYERANAAYFKKDYPEAERLALLAAEDAEKATKPEAAVLALKLAGWCAEERIQYATAMQYFRRAEGLIDSQRYAKDWALVEQEIADLLLDQGQYAEAEKTLRRVLEVHTRLSGPEDFATLKTRTSLASALEQQGKAAEAETQYRAVFKLATDVWGPEDWRTLTARGGLASALSDQGKLAEAEAEYREVLALREKSLGSESRDTLLARHNLATMLSRQDKYAEAEKEFRLVLRLREKVLGPEHPDTLMTRSNLGNLLAKQGKFQEAESELRDVIALKEKVLGPRHPETLTSFYNLALALARDGKIRDAMPFARKAVEGAREVLGDDNPSTKRYLILLDKLEKDRGGR